MEQVNDGTDELQTRAGNAPHSPQRPGRPAAMEQNVYLLLLAFRICNALTTRTFFQPDEYYQSLEPAWSAAFGEHSGAWTTWEWRHQLRSSLHPLVFSAVYQLVSIAASALGLPPSLRAELLIAAPEVLQAAFAAALDHFTWHFAGKVYGQDSGTAWTALALTICNPWQWFCSTRTLSNCIETTLTASALSYWPWHYLDARDQQDAPEDAKDKTAYRQRSNESRTQDYSIRKALLLAAFACILRPTNVLIWFCISIPTLWHAKAQERRVLLREAVICGSLALAASFASDYLFYGFRTFPPLRFLHFNIAQSLAVFYGTNRFHYYLTEGLPLLLTTALPFVAIAIWQIFRKPGKSDTTGDSSPQIDWSAFRPTLLRTLSYTIFIVTSVLSLISHKEVRFIYPLLPILHVLAARPLASFVFDPPSEATRKHVLTTLLTINVLIAGYTTQYHQRGVIDVMHYLRHEHEARLKQFGPDIQTTVAFLTPCHSTPWRSHLVHEGIDGFALTCEPPIDVPIEERGRYLDEADQFYEDPVAWMKRSMGDPSDDGREQSMAGRRPWPDYVVFFAQLENAMASYLNGSNWTECWRGFNSHFHDDWRRKGDVVVWCRERSREH